MRVLRDLAALKSRHWSDASIEETFKPIEVRVLCRYQVLWTVETWASATTTARVCRLEFRSTQFRTRPASPSSGNQSCATPSGCNCETDELRCLNTDRLRRA